MGYDIHASIELVRDAGPVEFVQEYDRINRNTTIFALMVGGHFVEKAIDKPLTPVSDHKGFPYDVTRRVKEEFFEGSYPSWLTLAELEEVQNRWEKCCDARSPDWQPSYESSDLLPIIDHMRSLGSRGIPRLVIWFDC